MKTITLCFLLILLSTVPVISQDSVSLQLPSGQPFLIYKNDHALIRFSYKDLISELARVQGGEGFESLKESEKDRINELMHELRTRNRESSSTSDILYLFSDNVVKQDELLVKIIEEVLGAGLLFKGKAAVWQRVPLKEIKTIKAEKNPRGNDQRKYQFYFAGSDSLFFKGTVIERNAKVSDLSGIKLYFHVADSISRTVLTGQNVKPGTYYEPRYPGGIEKFSRYLQKNLDCKGTVKKGKVYFLEFLVGTDGLVVPSSILVTNVGEDFSESCFLQLKKVITESERWIPAYLGKNVPYKLTIHIVFR